MKTIQYLFAGSLLLLSACAGNIPADNFDPIPDTPVEATPIPLEEEATPMPIEDDFIPMPPEPEDPIDGLKPGPVSNAYLEEISLLVMESYPIQLSLYVNGNLPTPCHELKLTVAAPNANNEIHIDIFSQVPDADMMCLQVLDPFDTSLPIDVSGLANGEYSLFVNGKLIGTFTYPG